MKDILKVSFFVFIGLFVAVILYPLTHEAGHSLAAVFFGAKIKEFSLVPLPNVMCDITAVPDAGRIIIALSGVFLPLFVCLLIHPRSFWVMCAVFIFKLTVLLSFLVSIAAVISQLCGSPRVYDDMAKALEYWNGGGITLLFMLSLGSLCVTLSVLRDRPFYKITKAFLCD